MEPTRNPNDPPLERPKTLAAALDLMNKAKVDSPGTIGGDEAPEVPPQGDEADVHDPTAGPTTDARLIEEFQDLGMLPPNFEVPKGKQAWFIKFRAELTERPELGDRYVILWTLSFADEKRANIRSGGQPSSHMSELTMGMIRSIDGRWTDVAGRQAKRGEKISRVEELYESIGPGGRELLTVFYMNQHSFTGDQKIDFFTNCVASRSAADSFAAAGSGTPAAAQSTPTPGR